jgi:Domain of unknown function (DUF4386)
LGSTRSNEITAGVLFIVATAASLTSAALMPDLTRAGYLNGVLDHQARLATASLLAFVAAVCSTGIAVALYPVLRRSSIGLALGSVVFRTVEGVFYIVGAVSYLSILTLARSQRADPAPDGAAHQAIADSLVAGHDRAAVVAVLSFCLGAGMYYLAFYRAQLVPRWLSGWGLAGVALMGVGAVLALFHDTEVTGYVPLALPIAVQEIVFALWLLVKGCTPQPLPPDSADAARTLTTRPA